MLDSTDAVLTFSKGKRKESLKKDRLYQSAVLRELEIIGEAAGHISEKTKRKFPYISNMDRV